jgi:hypothetical protein
MNTGLKRRRRDNIFADHSSLHGKIGRAEAVAMLWIALPIVFAVVTIIAVALVMSKPHP